MNLDLYHAQIGEGNLIALLRRAHSLDLIGEIQVADVPGRCEPGTGEINYPSIARALADLGYDGTVAMEAWAAEDTRPGPGPLPRRLHPGHPGYLATLATATAAPHGVSL